MKLIKFFTKAILLMFVITLFFGIYVTFIERNLLIVKKENIIIDEKKDKKVKLAHFTDTQLGDYYNLDDLKRAVKRINKLKPDVVVFTGDLIDHAVAYEDLHEVAEVLVDIEAKYGKYAVYGNHDIGGGALRYYEDIMSEAGFITLENENTTVEIDGEYINIFGGDDALMGIHNAEDTMVGIEQGGNNILLLHEPDLVEEYLDYPIDLVLSGHSHGGQVYIPFYGPIKKTLLAEKYYKGKYDFDNERGTSLYVSSGLGNTKVPFRLFNIPEIVLFNLYI